jgi:hypothetical protein
VLHTNDSLSEQIGGGLPELAAFNRDHAGGPRVWVHPDAGREVRVPVHAGAFSADLFGPVTTW